MEIMVEANRKVPEGPGQLKVTWTSGAVRLGIPGGTGRKTTLFFYLPYQSTFSEIAAVKRIRSYFSSYSFE